MIAISVIVPVYNVAAYLARCLDSLLAQTFQAFEIIVVNDGSNDRSGEICEEYALRDERVKVFHTENRGVSSARNLGIEMTRGEWCVFVDGDDLVGSRYLENLYAGIEGGSGRRSILVMAGMRRVQEGGWTHEDIIRLDRRLVDGEGIPNLYLEARLYEHGYVFAKMFRKQTMDDCCIRFHRDIRFGEDLIFFLEYLTHVDAIAIVDDCDYTYFTRVRSGLSKAYSAFKEEYEFFVRFVSVVDTLLKATPKDAIHRQVEFEFLLRAISCLYRPLTKLARCDRIGALKKVAAAHRDLLMRAGGGRSFALRWRFLGIFDFAYSTAYALRYSIFAKPWALFVQGRHQVLTANFRELAG